MENLTKKLDQVIVIIHLVCLIILWSVSSSDLCVKKKKVASKVLPSECFLGLCVAGLKHLSCKFKQVCNFATSSPWPSSLCPINQTRNSAALQFLKYHESESCTIHSLSVLTLSICLLTSFARVYFCFKLVNCVCFMTFLNDFLYEMLCLGFLWRQHFTARFIHSKVLTAVAQSTWVKVHCT